MPDLFDEAAEKPGADWPRDYEAQFWAKYPRKVGKIAAMKALAKARKLVAFAKLMAGVDQLLEQIRVRRTDPQYVPHPTTWLNQGRWDDEPPPPSTADGGPGGPRRPSFFEIATGRDRE